MVDGSWFYGSWFGVQGLGDIILDFGWDVFIFPCADIAIRALLKKRCGKLR
jgi:hypothetical protein